MTKKNKNIILILAILIFIAFLYIFILWNNLFVTSIIDDGKGTIKKTILGQRIYERIPNASGYLYKPKFLDKIIIPTLGGCGQILIYDGEKAYILHFRSYNKAENITSLVKKELYNFKNAKKIYFTYVYSGLTDISQTEKINIGNNILNELYKITPNVKYNLLKTYDNSDRKNNVYNYQIFFIFKKPFNNLKIINHTKLNIFKDFDCLVLVKNKWWYDFNQIDINKSEDFFKKVYRFIKTNSNNKNSEYIDFEIQKHFTLPSTLEFIISKNLYGINNNSLVFYKYIYNEKNQEIKAYKLNEKEVYELFGTKVISFSQNTRNIILGKRFFDKTYVIIFNNDENKLYKLKNKSLNINQKRVKAIFEIETFGKAFVDFDNGKNFKFYIIPEFLYNIIGVDNYE